MMQIVGSFAEFERAMLRERTRTWLAAARQDGRVGGRHPKLTPQQLKRLSRSSRWDRKQERMLPACFGFTLTPLYGFLPDTG